MFCSLPCLQKFCGSSASCSSDVVLQSFSSWVLHWQLVAARQLVLPSPSALVSTNRAAWRRQGLSGARPLACEAGRALLAVKSTGDSEENHHFILHLGSSCVAKRSREHFKSEREVCLTPILERNAPWSRHTVSFRSRRQRERPKLTGDSEGNHHYN